MKTLAIFTLFTSTNTHYVLLLGFHSFFKRVALTKIPKMIGNREVVTVVRAFIYTLSFSILYFIAEKGSSSLDTKNYIVTECESRCVLRCVYYQSISDMIQAAWELGVSSETRWRTAITLSKVSERIGSVSTCWSVQTWTNRELQDISRRQFLETIVLKC